MFLIELNQWYCKVNFNFSKQTNKQEKNHCQNCDLFTKYQTDNRGQKIMRRVRFERRGWIKGTDF